MALVNRDGPKPHYTLTSQDCRIIDTSAVLAWLLNEKDGDAVLELIANREDSLAFTSVVTIPQVARRLDIAVERCDLTRSEAQERWTRFASLLGKQLLVLLPTPEVVEKAVELTTPQIGAGASSRLSVEDAIHLAGALQMSLAYYPPDATPARSRPGEGVKMGACSPTPCWLNTVGRLWFVTFDCRLAEVAHAERVNVIARTVIADTADP